MELGKKLLQARQEAGLSQRQLCGEEITRNMLSQIEHGTARPSMDTLKYLAARLGKPVSYFLEEDISLSPNQQVILDARKAYAAGEHAKARLLLENYKPEDAVFEWEYRYLKAAATLSAAEKALTEGKEIYARELLTEIKNLTTPETERRRLLLLGSIPGSDLGEICRELPSLDEELLLRSREAMLDRRWQRAAQLLDAAEDTAADRWNLLRGQVYAALKDFPEAIRCFQKAEGSFPKETAPLLEQCFRDLGDYKMAYEYACKQK